MQTADNPFSRRANHKTKLINHKHGPRNKLGYAQLVISYCASGTEKQNEEKKRHRDRASEQTNYNQTGSRSWRQSVGKNSSSLF